MLLWIIFAGLTAAALIAVLWPLLRRNKAEKTDGVSFDAAIFKDQISEIESELDSGLISKAEAEDARTEVSRRLLAATKRHDAKSGRQSLYENSKIAGLALVAAFLLVPVTSSALYLVYGSPELSDQPLSARLSAPASGRNISSLVAKVEARLREHPQDGRGWEVIAPVYLRQQRFSDAADAFGRSLRILGETPQRLSDYGNALVLAQDGVVTEPARKVLQRAVSMDANMMRAWFWLAVAHEQDGDPDKAATAWRDLLNRSDANAPWREAVQNRLAAIERLTGSSKAASNEPMPQNKASDGVLKGPTRDEVAAASEMSAGDRAEMIGQMVAGLSNRLRNEGGNADEWKRLVRSYMVLGNKAEAQKALADARSEYSENSEILSEFDNLAQSLGLKDNP